MTLVSSQQYWLVVEVSTHLKNITVVKMASSSAIFGMIIKKIFETTLCHSLIDARCQGSGSALWPVD